MKLFSLLVFILLAGITTNADAQADETKSLTSNQMDSLAQKLAKSATFIAFLEETKKATQEISSNYKKQDHTRYSKEEFDAVLLDSTLTVTQRFDSLKGMGLNVQLRPSNINPIAETSKALHTEFPELHGLSKETFQAVLVKTHRLMNPPRHSVDKSPRIIATQKTAPSSSLGDYDKVFTKVQQPPQFPGGPEMWKKYLERNLNVNAASGGASPGTYNVKVQFITDLDGNVSNVAAIESPKECPHCAVEAVKVIKKGPKWQPAVQNGRNVVFQNVVTISFPVGAL